MLLADVHIFIYARRRESVKHTEYLRWLEDRLSGPEPFGVSEMVLSSLMRIITNHRIYKEPTAPAAAIDFCETILAAPAAVPLRPGPRHWAIFVELCRTTSARANAIPDAYLAALAIENGATLVTVDRGFARYPGLRMQAAIED